MRIAKSGSPLLLGDVGGPIREIVARVKAAAPVEDSKLPLQQAAAVLSPVGAAIVTPQVDARVFRDEWQIPGVDEKRAGEVRAVAGRPEAASSDIDIVVEPSVKTPATGMQTRCSLSNLTIVTVDGWKSCCVDRTGANGVSSWSAGAGRRHAEPAQISETSPSWQCAGSM
jgi:hypothetical protein